MFKVVVIVDDLWGGLAHVAYEGDNEQEAMDKWREAADDGYSVDFYEDDPEPGVIIRQY